MEKYDIEELKCCGNCINYKIDEHKTIKNYYNLICFLTSSKQQPFNWCSLWEFNSYPEEIDNINDKTTN